MEDLRRFLWKIGNDYNESYPSELVDEARDLFLKYNDKIQNKKSNSYEKVKKGLYKIRKYRP